MTASRARSLAWFTGTTSILLMLAALVVMFLDRNARLPQVSDSWTVSSVLDRLVNLGVPVIGILIASRRRENPTGWLFLIAGTALSVAAFSRAYAVHTITADPNSWPGGLAFGWVSNWTGPVPVGLLPTVFLLFPTGRLPSKRWVPVAWASWATLALLTLSAIADATARWSRPLVDHPFAGGNRSTAFTWTALAFILSFAALLVLAIVASASVVVRFRRTAGDERLQLKWFVTAAALVAITLAFTALTNSPTASICFSVALLFMYSAIAIAIVKHRLYDIDLVISRTLVFGSLAAFITVVYVVFVAGVGTVVGNRRSSLLSALAAAVVALAFQPVRLKARGLANRLVYGDRATPYEALSEFSERMGSELAADDLLPRMARILAEGTGARRSQVWLKVENQLRVGASWPAQESGDLTALPLGRDEEPSVTGMTVTVPVRHQGELLGALAIQKAAGDPPTPTEEKLLTDLASQAGLVLRNARLTAQLRSRLEELRASRQRIVTAQDGERRRIERNIHDGAQQQLVALAVKLNLAESLVGKDDEKVRAALAQVKSEAGEALADLRDLARGIYPPLLVDQGLVAALEAQARRSPVPVTAEFDGVGRYPGDVEAAVYFCCLEALQNAAKHAGASEVRLSLSGQDQELSFQVADDGAGFEPEGVAFGTGLQGMVDRVEAVGGSMQVTSAPGIGTTIAGRVPV